MSNYAKIISCDVVDGTNIGVSVFLSGCDATPKCKGCFNSEIWDKNEGNKIDERFYKKIQELLSNTHIKRLTILGGEPLAAYNMEATFELIKIARNMNKKIWVYTWRSFEDILIDPDRLFIVKYADVLVDGRFVEEQKDLTLAFRGSSNQRLIDVKKSLEQNKVVLIDSH